MPIESVKFVPVTNKDSGTTRQLLPTTFYKPGMTVARLIRACADANPGVTNGEISRFLTQYLGKTIRPQWVFNVRNTPLKSK